MAVWGRPRNGGGNGDGDWAETHHRPFLEHIQNRSQLAIEWLLGLAAFLLFALFVASFYFRIEFFAWGLFAACAAAIIGGALGVLFGLPISSQPATSIVNNAPAQTNVSVGGSTVASTDDTPSEAGGRTEPPRPQPEPARMAPSDLGYRDSTSLEQVADWLTKIIVGLTLVQFSSWEERYTAMARDLTEAMMGAPVSRACEAAVALAPPEGQPAIFGSALCAPLEASALPGGALIGLFATIGFLVSYLWMRRYFILEMVIARRNAWDQMEFSRLRKEEDAERGRQLRAVAAEAERLKAEAEVAKQKAEAAAAAAAATQAQREIELRQLAEEARQRLEAARSANLAQADPTRTIVKNAEIVAILDEGLARLRSDSAGHAKLLEIRRSIGKGEIDPDDPWRGQFGGRSEVDGILANGSAREIVDDPEWFEAAIWLETRPDRRGERIDGTKVLFFLHPTFPGQPAISAVDADQKARLEFFAYGAFTVGVLLENGVALELNLAQLPDAPVLFKAR